VGERRHRAFYVIVFVASGCTLVLELVAGRVLAPFVGVSIHTWTSIIGVVLAGISLGNYLGGTLADRAGSGRTLGVLLAAGGLASLAVLPLASGLGGLAPRSYPLVVRIVLLTTVLFFLPSLLLGMVPPVVVKLTLGDLGRAGNVVGRVYAWSTVGSLVGTFLTGFVLIAHVGTRAVILSVGLTLVALGGLAVALTRETRRHVVAAPEGV
jgi:predicted membrane-bound spermidine synthase